MCFNFLKLTIFSNFKNVYLLFFRVHIDAGTLEITSQLLQRKIQHEVNDFDNHLDDLEYDWANSNINKLLAIKAAHNS